MIAPIADALLPVLALIVLGYALRARGFVPEAFWPSLDKLNYWLFFPCMLFINLASANLEALPGAQIVLATWLALWLCAGLIWLMRRVAAGSDAAFTSLMQGGVRFNSSLALIIVPALMGGEHALLTAILVAYTVPMVNVIVILTLTRYGLKKPLRPLTLAREVLGNPYILASLAGFGWNQLGLGLTPGSTQMLTYAAHAALVCALLGVGAALDFSALRGAGRPLLWSTLFKFVALPILMLLCARLFALPDGLTRVMVFFQAMPTATSSTALARRMGGDVTLAAGIITLHAVLAFATLPLMRFLL